MTLTPALDAAVPAGQQARLGFDLTKISSIAESLGRFGNRFAQRLFTSREIAYAESGLGLVTERLAARFAAKEAVIKALSLVEQGIDWRDIEVIKMDNGACAIALHGHVARIAAAMRVRQILLSLSHEGDYAGAVVHVLLDPSGREHLQEVPHENVG